MPSPNLMDEIVLERDDDLGAPTSLITGRLGSGKTSLLVDIAVQLLKMKEEDDSRPDEKIFWRGQESCQWLKFHGEADYKILVPETTKVNFISEDSFDVEKNKFTTFPELYEKAEEDKINIVYCSFEEMIDLMDWIQKTKFSWNSIFCDEVEDLAPQGVGGKRFKKNKKVADILKESRKYHLSFYATTQSHSDIDWRVKKKIMAWIFLTGAPPRKDSPVWRSSIQALDIGEAWVSVGGSYSKFEYPPYTSDIKLKARVKHFDKRIPKPDILRGSEGMKETEGDKKKIDISI